MFGSDPKSLVTLAHSPTPGRQCEVVMKTVTIKLKRKLQIAELVRIRNLCYLQKKKKKKVILQRPQKIGISAKHSANPVKCFTIAQKVRKLFS